MVTSFQHWNIPWYISMKSLHSSYSTTICHHIVLLLYDTPAQALNCLIVESVTFYKFSNLSQIGAMPSCFTMTGIKYLSCMNILQNMVKSNKNKLCLNQTRTVVLPGSFTITTIHVVKWHILCHMTIIAFQSLWMQGTQHFHKFTTTRRPFSSLCWVRWVNQILV